MLLTTGLVARRTLLVGLAAWQAQSVAPPALAAQRGAEDAYAVSLAACYSLALSRMACTLTGAHPRLSPSAAATVRQYTGVHPPHAARCMRRIRVGEGCRRGRACGKSAVGACGACGGGE